MQNDITALCALCDVTSPDVPGLLVKEITAAPDPETAVQLVFSRISVPTVQLERKWREAVFVVWKRHNPTSLDIPGLELTQQDVAETPTLNDAKALLTELTFRPGQLRPNKKNWHLPAHEVVRLSAILPSQDPEVLPRLGAILETLRLARQVKDQLIPVYTRLKRWEKLPVVQQWYMLWHADAYHVPWGNLDIIQDNITSLWSNLAPVEADVLQSRQAWSTEVSRLYFSSIHNSKLANVLQQITLPGLIDQMLLENLFARHGLITLEDQEQIHNTFAWTNLGEHIVNAEAKDELPCSVDLLR